MRIGMIVLAGGIGKRIGRPLPKQFLLLGGTPLLVHVLDKARALAAIERVVITCPEGYMEQTSELLANHRLGAKFECILGGDSRQESVYRGLRALDTVDSVIVHEAVRPLVTLVEFDALIATADENVTYGIPISFTVLKGHEYVEGLLDRDELVNVQLPQKFNREALLQAHEAARREGKVFTEDASLLVAYTAERVRILQGSDRNIKITVPTDVVTAEAMYADLVRRGA